MAINFDNLFKTVGVFLSPLNRLRIAALGGTDAIYGDGNPDVPSLLAAAETMIGGLGFYDILSGVPEVFAQTQDVLVGQSDQMLTLIEKALKNKSLVLNNLFLGSTPTVAQIMPALFAAMVAGSKSVLKNTVTLGTPAVTGTGNGVFYATKVLDGVNPPWVLGIINPGYAGHNSEIASGSETVQLICTNDSYTGTQAEGSEGFTWNGLPTSDEPFDWRPQGSGGGPVFPLLNSYVTVLNRNFETFTVANTPDLWLLLASNVVGTHVFSDTTVWRGTKALKLVGDGTVNALGVSQAIPVSQLGLKPLQGIALSVAMKADTTFASTTFTMTLSGTGMTPIVVTKALASISAGYHLYAVDGILPSVIPTDLTLTIAVTAASGGVANGKQVWVDSIGIGPVVYHGGFGVYGAAGSTPFVKGDQAQLTVANDYAGVFQSLFARAYKAQLPSVSSSPTTTEAWGE